MTNNWFKFDNRIFYTLLSKYIEDSDVTFKLIASCMTFKWPASGEPAVVMIIIGQPSGSL
jgi:hypothetical protein